MRNVGTFIAIAASLLSGQANAQPDWTDVGLTQIVSQRLLGDRTEACFAVALIEDQVRKTVVCASEDTARDIDPDTAFEVGSISKTMTAVILAGLIEEGRLALNDPLSKILPTGTELPEFDDQPIRLRHLVTHSSGLPALPSRMQVSNPANPYASLTERQLLDSLADVELSRAPGSAFEYSNFAMMVLSYGLAHYTGKSFDELLTQYVTAPSGMARTYTQSRPEGVQAAQGHTQNGSATGPWDFAVNTNGVGGVRASLDDMIRYAQANLGSTTSDAARHFQATHAEIASLDGTTIGMNWIHVPLGGRKLLMHEGGTGGFSSLLALDPEAKRAVVILSDTSVTAINGLGGLGLHLLDPTIPLPPPRTLAEPPVELLENLSGRFVLEGGLGMTVTHEDGALYIQATGQPRFKMAYDSAGDFFPEAFDALLRPQPAPGGYRFVWIQGGGPTQATRLDQPEREAPSLSAAQLAEYEGEYPLFSGFGLRVFVEDEVLFVQGTGQQALEVVAIDTDQFGRDDVGARFVFPRGEDGKVESLTLHQAGQTLNGSRQ